GHGVPSSCRPPVDNDPVGLPVAVAQGARRRVLSGGHLRDHWLADPTQVWAVPCQLRIATVSKATSRVCTPNWVRSVSLAGTRRPVPRNCAGGAAEAGCVDPQLRPAAMIT